MLELRTLTQISAEDLRSLGAGYTSLERYRVSKVESDARTVFTVQLEALQRPFKKVWPENASELDRYRGYLEAGLSVGAYLDEGLVGLAIVEHQAWNNTLWIWELRVSERHRRQGIGRRLIERVTDSAVAMGCRAVGLECQATNVPAIRFYRSVGFELDGLDLSLYSNSDAEQGEVCFYMKRKLTSASPR